MREKILLWIAESSVIRNKFMIALVTAVTLVMGVLASRLEISTSYTEMMPQGNEKAEEFEHILDEFNNASNIILLVEGDEKILREFAEYLIPRIEDLDQWVDRVDAKVPEEFYRRHALKLLKPQQMKNFEPLYETPDFLDFLNNLNDSFEKEYQGEETLSTREKEINAVRFLDAIETFIKTQDMMLSGESEGESPGEQGARAMTIGETYFFSPDRHMLLIMIEPVFNMIDDFNIVVEAVDGIEKVVKQAAEKFDVNAGLTGSLVLGRDELRAVESDSWTITTIALIGIFFLFVISFRMWISPVLAILTVIIGVIWALGIASLLVDNLNMSTAMMGVILVGLGIDFSVHIISSYTELRHTGLNILDTMRNALLNSGPGIITGGLTTAAAFLTMIVSDNRGMWEMGLISGFGIITTMLASLVTLPTLLVLRENILRKTDESFPVKDISYRFLGNTARHVTTHKFLYTGALILLTAFLSFQASKIKMDYNYLNMEPVGLESIKLQEKLIDAFDLSSDFVLVTASDLDEVRRLTEKGREMSTSGWVESITDFLPDPKYQKERFHFIRDIRRNIRSAEVRKEIQPRDVDFYLSELERLEFNIIELQDLSYIQGQDRIYEKSANLVGTVDDTTRTGRLTALIERISLMPDITRQLTYYHREFSRTFKDVVLEMANSEPLTVDLLPKEIRDRFVGKNGDVFLISIYPRKNIWEDTKFLYRFTREAESVSPKVTGLPPMFVELMGIMAKDGKNATLLAILAVFLLLLFDFKRLSYALLGMTPLIFGAVWMVGVMESSGLMLNMVNIMAIPLIIGIGIDDGVHVLHRFQKERDVNLVFRSTGKAILLTSLTTMMGFGSLWFATYRGLGSMGISLFIGVGTCFLSTLFIIPAILGYIHKRAVKA